MRFSVSDLESIFAEKSEKSIEFENDVATGVVPGVRTEKRDAVTANVPITEDSSNLHVDSLVEISTVTTRSGIALAFFLSL